MNIKFYAKWAVSTWFGSLYQESYCAEWDAALNRLLDKHGDSAALCVSVHTVSLGPHRVWVSNAYYSYGHLYGEGHERRPGLRTMARLDRVVRRLRSEIEEKKRKAYSEMMARIGQEASHV